MKKIAALVLAAVLCIAMAAPAFAFEYGSWEYEPNMGFKWIEHNYDGSYSYPVGTWEWIDDDGDGAAQCFRFDNGGYMYESCWTPEGYYVNSIGEWADPDSGYSINVACAPYEAWIGYPWD